MTKITVEINCSGGCGEPLKIDQKRYLQAQKRGQQNFYHRPCFRKYANTFNPFYGKVKTEIT